MFKDEVHRLTFSWRARPTNCLISLLSFLSIVDMKHMRKQVRNRNALLIGVSLQFIVLPFLGFCVVKILNMSAPMGITLLVVTSSPGGSYSNWWCRYVSMWNV